MQMLYHCFAESYTVVIKGQDREGPVDKLMLRSQASLHLCHTLVIMIFTVR